MGPLIIVLRIGLFATAFFLSNLDQIYYLLTKSTSERVALHFHRAASEHTSLRLPSVGTFAINLIFPKRINASRGFGVLGSIYPTLEAPIGP